MNSLDKKVIEMQDQLALLHRQREAARLEGAKSYADAFIRKLEANDIPLAVVGCRLFRISRNSAVRGRCPPHEACLLAPERISD